MKRLTTALTLLILFSGFTAAQNTNTDEVDETVKIQKMTAEPSPLKIGQYAEVRFKVTNKMDKEFDNVTVRFNEEYPFSVDPDNQKKWSIATLEPGDSYEFRMQVRVDANAVQRDDSLKIEVETDDSTFNKRLPVELKADDDGLLIKNVQFPEDVASGTSNQMNVTIENTANAHFRNIDLSLSPSAQTPVVVSGTSTRRISSIAPDQTETLQYQLNVDESAENGVYSIPVNMNYENEGGASLTQSATTGIVVGGSPQVEVGLSDDGEINAGTTGAVNFRFVNRGEGTAKFVKVEVQESEDYTIRTGKSVYLGDMSSDDYQTAETTVYTEEGKDSITLPVQVTYQENGQEQSFTEDVPVNVLTAEERQLYTTSSSSPVLPIVAVLVIGAGAVYYWRKRR